MFGQMLAQRDKYKDWAFETKGYFCAQQELMLDAFDCAESWGKQSSKMDHVEQQNPAFKFMSRSLYHNLTGLLKGESKNMLKNVTDNNGLEVWRQLFIEFEPQIKARYGGMLSEVLATKFKGQSLGELRAGGLHARRDHGLRALESTLGD